MIGKQDRNVNRKIRHARVRRKISGTAEKPRMNVFRSLNNIYVQIINDEIGHTLISASTLDPELKDKAKQVNKKEAAKMVGELVAKKALEKGINEVVFDRGGYLYTGRVAQVAAGAREAGLKF